MYQALYRKWRPRSFDDVVGQQHITDTLKNQISSQRLSHAYLFIGTRGTGKTTCAKILAKAVNCESPVNGNPCNRCPNCLGIDDGSILDVVEMDAASNNGVDNVRQLRDEAVFSPATAKKRVYIIDEVHMLSTAAFNALLKILEEPPSHLMFILATTELHKVPATILSRCQRHSFKRLDTDSIRKRLIYVAQQESIDLSPDAADLISSLSEGGMRDALSILDQCSGRDRIDLDTVYSAMGMAGRRETASLLRHIASGDTACAIRLFNDLWQNGKDPSTLLGELSTLQRDILMCAVAPKGGKELLTGGYDDATLSYFSKQLSAAALINNINIIQSSLADMRNGQAKTICELCIISMCEPELGEDLPLIRQRVARLENMLKSGVPVRSCPAAESPAEPETIPSSAEGEPAALPAEDEPPFDLPAQTQEREASPSAAPAPVAPPPAVPAPEPSAPAPAESGSVWEQVKNRLAGSMPVGLRMIITDPAQVDGTLSGNELVLRIVPGFAMNMLDRPDIISRIGAEAADITGSPVNVRVMEYGSDPAPAQQNADAADKLEQLAKFDIVKFK